MKTSLGLLEVSGLALAIRCADAMAKAASVTLLGMEKTNGSGWTVVEITGDVASVQSAIATGADLARQLNGLVAQKVIARPAQGLMAHQEKRGAPAQPVRAASLPEPEPAPAPTPLTPVNETAPQQAEDAESAAPAPQQPEPAAPARVSCNLCLDPACPRQKGEPRAVCIHNGKKR
ncbi:BMC domain-containing protein [Entomohabitans teleogrylli]|uniref:BMC domain-containing protein n=1 Tax=Entomohabitans teleogrylli TaxID=1384589 RepID=UPI00073D7B33|nr:BMC domain-containing protein [Entomohabitans teleogrylli]